MKVINTCSFLLLIVLFFSAEHSHAQIQNPPNTESYNRGIDLYEEGLFTESIRHLREFRQKNPLHELKESADFYLARALTAADSANIEAYYQQFVLNYPAGDLSVILLKDLGHRFTENGNYEEAITFYQQAIASWMNQWDEAETRYWIAEAAAENENHEAAIHYFLEVAEMHSNSEWAQKALYARGRLYLEQEEF